MVKKIKPHQSLIVLSDYPRLDKNPLRINKSYIKDRSKRNHYDVLYPKDQAIIDTLNLYPNCHYLDITKDKTFADAPFYKDTIMYYDGGHLNVYGEKVYFNNTGHEVMNLIDSIWNNPLELEEVLIHK